MTCINCNQNIPEDSLFCPFCGAKQVAPPPVQEPKPVPVPEKPVAPTIPTPKPVKPAENIEIDSARCLTIYKLPPSLYTAGSPVSVVSGSLQKDPQAGISIAKLEFKNLTKKTITGLMVSIDAFDKSDSPLSGVAEYYYLNLNADRDAVFGQEKTILLPDANTRRIQIQGIMVFFADGENWESPAEAIWESLPSLSKLDSAFCEELVAQYRLETVPAAQFLPLNHQDLWFCTCGAINRNGEPTCHSCSSNRSNLISLTDKETLNQRLQEEIERQCAAALKLEEEKEQQRLAAEAAALQHQKTVRITVAILLVFLGVCLLTSRLINNNHYKDAEYLLAAGDYDEAIDAFTELKKFKDAPVRIQEAWYAKAELLLADGNYDEAKSAFFSAGAYMDARLRVYECLYSKGEYLLARNQYDDAIAAFSTAGKYNFAPPSDDSLQRISKILYTKATTLLEAGDAAGAAIAFGQNADYLDSWERSLGLWNDIFGRNTIAAGQKYSVCLSADGTVVTAGANTVGQCNVSGWTDIVAVAAGNYHTVGLRSDGTVVAVGANAEKQCEVSEWTDIVAIDAGNLYSIGLRMDGTAVITSRNNHSLLASKISELNGLVAIAAGGSHIVALKYDGSVIALGNASAGLSTISEWTDIVAIDAYGDMTVGVRSDGTVVAYGPKAANFDFSNWSDIVGISIGPSHVVGLRSDGTVISTGEKNHGRCDTSRWSNIVAVAAGHYHTLGLRANGTVVACGDNSEGQCNVSSWRNITTPTTN